LKQLAVAGLGIVLILGAVRSASRQRVWRDNDALFAQTVLDAPTSYRARMMNSFALKAQKRDAEALDELRLARLIFPEDPELLEYTAVEYGNMQRCPLAIPLYRRALELDSARILARQGLTICLMIIGDFAGARSEVVKGLARGGARDSFLRLRVMADSLEAAGLARSALRK
jgi:Flp pilus assembly protein TadD